MPWFAPSWFAAAPLASAVPLAKIAPSLGNCGSAEDATAIAAGVGGLDNIICRVARTGSAGRRRVITRSVPGGSVAVR
jgi:hypothetical protein